MNRQDMPHANGPVQLRVAGWRSFALLFAVLLSLIIIFALLWPSSGAQSATLQRSGSFHALPWLVAEIHDVDGKIIPIESANIILKVGTHRFTVTCRSKATGEESSRILDVTVAAGEEYVPYVKVDEHTKPCAGDIRQLVDMRI
jgi:hypothetical protein